MAVPIGESLGKAARVLVFGQARWDRAARRLSVRGMPVKLPWRVAEALSVLLEARGAVVTKEELQRQIWGGGLIDDSNLAHCVKALRKAIDPAPDGGSYIETVARVGYRMAATVIEEDGAAEPVEEVAVPARGPHRYAFVAGILVLLTLLAGGLLAWKHAERRQRADDLIRRGLGMVRRNVPNEAAKGVEFIRQADGLVPGYPLAQAALAESAARRGVLSWDAALDLARAAIEKDPRCGECEAIAGYVFMTRGWKWEEAGRHLARAVELDGNGVTRRIWYAEWLAIQNRLPEALEQAQAAVRLAPDEPRAHAMLAGVHYLAGRYREAIAAAEKAVSLDETLQQGHYWAYRSHMILGAAEAAIFSRCHHLTAWHAQHEEEFYKCQFSNLEAHKAGGREGLARAWVRAVDTAPGIEVQRYARAVWSIWMGDREGALNELAAAVKSKPYHLIHVGVDPVFQPLWGEPRFQEVVRRVGLKPPQR